MMVNRTTTPQDQTPEAPTALAEAGAGLSPCRAIHTASIPSQQAFAKLRGQLRTAATRMGDDLNAAICEAPKHVTTTECRHYDEVAGHKNDLAIVF